MTACHTLDIEAGLYRIHWQEERAFALAEAEELWPRLLKPDRPFDGYVCTQLKMRLSRKGQAFIIPREKSSQMKYSIELNNSIFF